MMLIVGLGNPGEEYKGTRHNIGREIVEALERSLDKTRDKNFRFEKKWNALVAERKIGKVPKPAKRAGIPAAESGLGKKAVLLLPNTFMNKSGNAIAPVARFYKVKPKDTYVVHDDADLPLGRAKLSFGKHSAGHKGVESVIRNLKTIEFWRFRIGIGGKRDVPAEKLVLKKFTPDELKLAKKIQKKTIEAIETVGTDGPEKAMNSYNS